MTLHDDIDDWFIDLARRDPASAELVAGAIDLLEREGPTLDRTAVDRIPEVTTGPSLTNTRCRALGRRRGSMWRSTKEVLLPTASTLRFPSGYGMATRTIAWAEVRGRLEVAPAYWLSTARPDSWPGTSQGPAGPQTSPRA